MSKKSKHLSRLKFNGFERYPPQHEAIYIKCEGLDRQAKKYVRKYLRANSFNAATFDPEKMRKILSNENVSWEFSWYPAEEIDKIYGKDSFD